jgi:hypothetical protein
LAKGDLANIGPWVDTVMFYFPVLAMRRPRLLVVLRGPISSDRRGQQQPIYRLILMWSCLRQYTILDTPTIGRDFTHLVIRIKYLM